MTQPDQFDFNLSGKVAIVTGAANGIGASIATALSNSQASVVVSDIDDESGRRLVDRLDGESNRAIHLRADVSDAADVDRLFRETINKFKKVDLLVNNVGIRYRKPMLELSDEEWDRVIATNLSGTFRCIQRAARFMAQQKSGNIVNISSQARECSTAAARGVTMQLPKRPSYN